MCAWTAWLLLPHKNSQRCFPPLFLVTIPSVTWTRRISHTHTTRCFCWRARGSGGWWAAEIADGAPRCHRTAWCPAETWSSSGSTSVTFTAALWEPHADDEIWSQISLVLYEEGCSTLLNWTNAESMRTSSESGVPRWAQIYNWSLLSFKLKQ